MNSRTPPVRPFGPVAPFTWAIAFILALHCSVIGIFPHQVVEPLLSGAMQLFSAAVATAVCLSASRRRDFARPFWLLLGCSLALWSTGQALYLFNKYYLHSLNLLPNLLLFLFFIATLPLSIAVLGRTSNLEDTPTWLRWFDGAQVVGIILAACLLNLDLASGKNGLPQIELRLFTVHVRNVIIAVALLVRTLINRGKIRQLYASVCLAFSIFALSTWLGNQALELWGAKSGQWWDLCWSVPFTLIAIAAAQWSHSQSAPRKAYGVSATEVQETPSQAAVAQHLTEYLYPIVLSVSLVVLALKGMEVQREIAVVLVLSSLICFFARTSIVQCHRARLLAQMRKVLDNTKRLTGYLPLCAACKMIRDESGGWRQLEGYLREYTEAEFTHGICPECTHRLYPEYTQGS